MTRRGRPPHPDILTPREWEVLELLRQDLSNSEIAERLDITERGVKFHVSEIISKLGVSSRHEAAEWRPEDAAPEQVRPARLRRWALAPLGLKIAGAVVVCAAIGGAAALALGLILSGSGPSFSPENNLFLNAGFESTTADGTPDPSPWTTLSGDSGFVISDDHAHTGTSSALLHMDDPVDAEGGKVYYLVQEVTPEDFPDYLEGYYRVENWNRGTAKQYLQFVVIAFSPTNFPDYAQNYQIRYPIAGIGWQPFELRNAYFEFLNTDDPVEGEWVKFSAPIRDDFKRLWNAVPEDFEYLRLLFEVRWDSKVAGDGAPTADVYYDDLYIGPAP